MPETMIDEDVKLVLTRTLPVPVERVFAALTDPDMLRRWMAPGDMTVGEAVSDARAGGAFRIEMRGADSGETPTVSGSYQEIVKNRRVVTTWQWENSDVETLLTYELEAHGEHATRLTLTHTRFRDAEQRDLHGQGWTACLAKLDGLFARGVDR